MEDKKIIINGHEAVDLGLSVKWATCNIGATNPEDLGEKYHYGEIEPPTEKSRFYDEEKGFVDHTIIGLHYRRGYKRWRYKKDGITRSIIIYPAQICMMSLAINGAQNGVCQELQR